MEIASESRDGRHTDDSLPFLTLLVSSHDTLDERSAKFVAHRALVVVCCGDEELVLDVYEMLRVLDDFDVGVCN